MNAPDSPPHRNRLRRAGLAGAYFAVVALIVWLADHRETRFVFDWLRAFPLGDKLGHFLIMGGFALVVNHALRCRTVPVGRWRFLLGSLLVFTLAGAEEFSQRFIPGRTFDLFDLLADGLGVWLLGRLACRSETVAKP